MNGGVVTPPAAQVTLVAVLVVVGIVAAVALGAITARSRASTMSLLGAGAVLSAVLIAAAGELTDQVIDGDGVTGFDRPVWSWFVAHRNPAETAVADTVSAVLGTGVVAVLAGLVVVALLVRRHRADAALVTVVTAGAAVLVVTLKDLVGRPRPPVGFRLAVETNPSFPSGHALVAAAVLGALAVVARRRCRPLPARAVVLAVLVAVPTVGLSRLYLGVHWDSDVLAGWLIGGLWLAVCLTLRELLRLWDERPQVDDLLETT